MDKSSDTEERIRVDRREAVRHIITWLGGAAVVGRSNLLAALERPDRVAKGTPGKFTAANVAFLDEIAETILPETKTPGAKAAKTGAFMARMVTDCYNPLQQRVFREGMRKVDEASLAAHKVSFMKATQQQRLAVLEVLDREQKQEMDARLANDQAPVDEDEDKPVHYFRMMKQLALLGYFTSEIGCTQAMRYIEVPGRFDPCAPYTPGETAWAAHA